MTGYRRRRATWLDGVIERMGDWLDRYLHLMIVGAGLLAVGYWLAAVSALYQCYDGMLFALLLAATMGNKRRPV